MRAIVEHGVQAVGNAGQQIVAYQDDGDARGAGVVLGVNIDEGETGDVKRIREKIGGHIAHHGRRGRLERSIKGVRP